MARKKSSRLPYVVLGLGVALGAGYALRDHLPLESLRAWILPPPPPPPSTGAKPKSHGKRHASSGASLSGGSSEVSGRPSMPAPKPCLSGPTGAGMPEDGVVASRGLDGDQVRAAMSKVVTYALPCFADAPTGVLTLSVTAGCDGRVSDLKISDDGGYPSDVTGCVVEILRNAEFPAHDLPDGYTFTYPVRYTAP